MGIMPRSPRSPDPEGDRRSNKKMRKGTHSCFECRRRKIRCIFSSDNPAVCSECFARGSKCMGQEEADVDASSLDNRKNLRERVAKLEALVEALSQDRPNPGQESYKASVTPGEPLLLTNTSLNPRLDRTIPSLSENSNASAYGQSAPFLSIFNDDSNISADAGDKMGQDIPSSREAVKQRKIKDSNTRRALLANLPEDRADLNKAVANTEIWWTITQRLYHGFCGFGLESSMAEFAAFAIENENPAILGAFLLSLAANGQENEHNYINVVSSLIVSDDDYAATMEGIECMVLLAKYHADIGQPRKSWMTFRRAIMFGELIGLPRFHSSSARRDAIFWSIYEADHYLSMLLGLPHGIPDSHCELNIDPNPGCSITVSTKFRRRAAILAGKVVDRNQGGNNISYSTAIDLDQELDDLAASMPSNWWDLAQEAPLQDDVPFGIRHEARLAQITFYEVKLYLHLPYMLKTAANPRYEFSRNACFDAARRGLQTYHLLHCNRSLVFRTFYDCQVINFIGFTSAVVFLLGLLGYGNPKNSNGNYSNSEDEDDWQLIYRTLEIVRKELPSRDGAMAQQCYQALKFLSNARYCNSTCSCSGDVDPIINIPYFGTLRIGKSKFAEIAKQRSANNSAAPTPESQNGCPVHQMPTPPNPQPLEQNMVPNHTEQPQISYNGLYMPALDNFNFDMSQNNTGIGSAASDPGAYWWQINANMDIDQDWNWFMTGC